MGQSSAVLPTDTYLQGALHHSVPSTLNTCQQVPRQPLPLPLHAGWPFQLRCAVRILRGPNLVLLRASVHDQGLEVIAFFHSSAESVRSHAGGRRYPFRLIADPTLDVYRLYGVETSWWRLLLSAARPRFYLDWVRSMRHGFWGGAAWQMGKMPADFLIGPDGHIAIAHYGADIGDHVPFATIESFLQSLQTTPERGQA